MMVEASVAVALSSPLGWARFVEAFHVWIADPSTILFLVVFFGKALGLFDGLTEFLEARLEGLLEKTAEFDVASEDRARGGARNGASARAEGTPT